MMKKVIFICLLSISTCLSTPTGMPGPPQKDAGGVTEATTLRPSEKGSTLQANTSIVHPAENATHVISPTAITKASAAPVTEQAPPTNPDKNKTKTDDKGKNEPIQDDKKLSSTPAPKPAPPMNGTTPAEHDKKGASTVKPTEPTKTTEAPSKEDDKIVQARGFDGASFVGGIIMTLGFLAIGFMGFKYYKNHTERNYHTL